MRQEGAWEQGGRELRVTPCSLTFIFFLSALFFFGVCMYPLMCGRSSCSVCINMSGNISWT